MIISIDHGNKQIKTVHKTFVSGLSVSEVRPALGEGCLHWNGKYYTLSGSRLPYRRDKTTDESFFVLTLFGIAYEILNANAYAAEQTTSVDLLVGLPPAHYGALYQKFEQYFNRGTVQYSFDGQPFSIYFNSVTAYPQAYAAAMTVFGQLRQLPKCVVVDIGGFTSDYMLLKNGAPDMASCSSLEHGVIVLYNRIIMAVNSAYDLLLDETDIDAALRGQNGLLSDAIVQSIHQQAQDFSEDLFSQLRERMIDLRAAQTVFVGGGASLLRPFLECSPKVGKCLFVEELNANARGYEMLYRVQAAAKGGR